MSTVGCSFDTGGEAPCLFQPLDPQAKAKSVYERELMAMVFAIRKWRLYLLGQRIIVRTDQRSLKYLLEQRVVEGEHHKWLLKLLNYNFEIQYKQGKRTHLLMPFLDYPLEIP